MSSILAFAPLYAHFVYHFLVDSGEKSSPIGAMPGCERLGWRHGLIDEVGVCFSQWKHRGRFYLAMMALIFP